jgi:hypothetical protein
VAEVAQTPDASTTKVISIDDKIGAAAITASLKSGARHGHVKHVIYLSVASFHAKPVCSMEVKPCVYIIRGWGRLVAFQFRT